MIQCPTCGNPLPADIPGGFCPSCMLAALESALDDPTEGIPSDPGPADDGVSMMIDRYCLLEMIGEGGFGVVYRAEQRLPIRREVALKLLKPGMDSRQVIARFEAERQALALMDHPGIAKVLDAGTSPSGRPYFVMELIDGLPITRFCDQQHLDTIGRLELFVEVCLAVQHAHQKGIIHRDLKPSNVLVGIEGDRRFLKIIDFGIAKALDRELTDKTFFTRDFQVLGTPHYLAPEQATIGAREIDTRSDVYSLGVMLYELLAGMLPFPEHELLAAGLEAMWQIIREKDPPRPSTQLNTLAATTVDSIAANRETSARNLHNILRGDLDWITLKALEKEPARRYQGPGELAADIRRFLDNKPIEARPPSRIYQLGKFVRRNKGLVASLAAILAVLAVATGVSLWQAREADIARGKAEREANKTARALELEAVSRKDADEANEVANSQRGLAEQRLGDSQKLLRESSKAHCFQAMREWEEGRHNQAIAFAARAVELCPDNQPALGFLANLLRETPVIARILCDPESSIEDFTFVDDGAAILTFSTDNTLRKWDPVTGHELLRLPVAPGKIAAMTPVPNSQRVLLLTSTPGQEDWCLRAWDLTHKNQLWEKPVGRTTNEPPEIAPSGRFAAILDDDNEISIVATDSGALRGTIKAEKHVRCPHFINDDEVLVEQELDGLGEGGLAWRKYSDSQYFLHDLRTGMQTQVKCLSVKNVPPLLQVKPSPEIVRIRSVHEGIFEARTLGKSRIVVLDGNAGRQRWLGQTASSPTKWLQADGDLGTVILNSATNREMLKAINETGCDKREGYSRRKGLLRDVSFSPDGNLLAACSPLGPLALWSIQAGYHVDEDLRLQYVLDSKVIAADKLLFSPDSASLAFETGGTIRVVPTLPSRGWNLRIEGTRAALSPTSKLLVMNNPVNPQSDTRVKLANLENGRTTELSPTPTKMAHGYKFSSDGRWVVVDDSPGFSVWAVADGQARLRCREMGAQSIDFVRPHWLAYHRDGVGILNLESGKEYHLAGAWFEGSTNKGTEIYVTRGQTLSLWHPETGALEDRSKVGQHLRISPDGSFFVHVEFGQTILQRFTDGIQIKLAGGEKLETRKGFADSIRILIDDNSRRVLGIGRPLDHVAGAEFGKNDEQLGFLWDARTGALLADLTGKLRKETELSANGLLVATTDRAGRVSVYSTSNGELLWSIEAHQGEVDSIRFSSDGSLLLTAAGSDRTVRIWDCETGSPIALLSTRVRGTGVREDFDQIPLSVSWCRNGKGIMVQSGYVRPDVGSGYFTLWKPLLLERGATAAASDSVPWIANELAPFVSHHRTGPYGQIEELGNLDLWRLQSKIMSRAQGNQGDGWLALLLREIVGKRNLPPLPAPQS